jgi:hypothetical protein
VSYFFFVVAVADLEEMVEEDLEDAGGSFFLFAALEPMEGDLSPDDDINICMVNGWMNE